MAIQILLKKNLNTFVQVWDACSDGLISFDKNNMSEDLCRITENDLIVSALTQVLQTELKSLISVRYDTKIKSCIFPSSYTEDEINSNKFVHITTEDGESFKTKLLVLHDLSSYFLRCLASIFWWKIYLRITNVTAKELGISKCLSAKLSSC